MGEYIISICTFNEFETGNFCLEMYLEDELVNNKALGNNSLEMKYTYLERLNPKNGFRSK